MSSKTGNSFDIADLQKRAEDHLRLVIDTTPAMIHSGRPDGYLDYFNKRWLEYLGLPLEAIAGWRWASCIHPDDVDELLRQWRASLASGEPLHCEARVRRADGEYRWMLHRKIPLCDEAGNIVQWFGSSVDIHDRKQIEDALRTSEGLLAEAQTLTHVGSYVVRPPDITEYWSAECFKIFGLDPQDGSPRNLDEMTPLVHADDRAEFRRKATAFFAEGASVDHKFRIVRPSGEVRVVRSIAAPVFEDATVTRYVGAWIDITEQEQMTEELHKLKDQLYRENLALKNEINQASMFEDIVGSSDPLRRVLTLIARVAPTDSTVLLTGETGTGKELAARAIHKRSNRAARPFVSVNCGAMVPSLINSELFGYERGAFTGAMQRHLGRFELADGGTIFLDEAGDLPQETQISLLRVLQERTFERVGGTHLIPVDVRVVAATNRDLDKAVADGVLRHDLYYRLNVFPVHMPPLRERADDIPLLVEYFTQRYAAKIGKKISKVEKRTLKLLTDYKWPGNVRELQNVVERAVILCDGDALVVDETWLKQPAPEEISVKRGLGRRTVSEEKQMIEAALAAARGRVFGSEGAAAKLGVPRSTLESRIRSLRIDKNRFKSQ